MKVDSVYVPVGSRTNFELGMQSGVWGWRDSRWAMPKAQESIRSIMKGQVVFFGFGVNSGANPRQAEWTVGSLERLVVGVISRPCYEDTTPLWPDGPYSHRVAFEAMVDLYDVDVALLPAPIRDAIRRSSNAGSAPYSSDLSWTLNQLAQVCAELSGAAPPGSSMDPSAELEMLLSFERAQASDVDGADVDASTPIEQFDIPVLAYARAEARAFRRHLFGSAANTRCDLCRRVRPVSLTVAAHIKRRSHCSDDEKKDPSVVMRACLFGCDALFEVGAVYIDSGVLRAGPTSAISSQDAEVLVEQSGIRVGEPCLVVSDDNREYFEWHRMFHGH